MLAVHSDRKEEHMPGTGSLEVITGPMFSGKTEELIRRLRRARIARLKVQVFKPALDTRFQPGKVISHAGADTDAIPIPSANELLRQMESDTRVVAIDETQFFDDEIVPAIQELADDDIRVIVAGLDTDFRAEPFGPMPLLMAKAERLDKLAAICMVCGNPASRTQRLILGQPASYFEPIIAIGAADVYEARCRAHHVVPRE
jgi:thymidine kinase